MGHCATGNPEQHLEAVQLSTFACLAEENPQWFTRVFRAFYNCFSSSHTALEFICHHIKIYLFFRFLLLFCLLLWVLIFSRVHSVNDQNSSAWDQLLLLLCQMCLLKVSTDSWNFCAFLAFIATITEDLQLKWGLYRKMFSEESFQLQKV